MSVAQRTTSSNRDSLGCLSLLPSPIHSSWHLAGDHQMNEYVNEQAKHCTWERGWLGYLLFVDCVYVCPAPACPQGGTGVRSWLPGLCSCSGFTPKEMLHFVSSHTWALGHWVSFQPDLGWRGAWWDPTASSQLSATQRNLYCTKMPKPPISISEIQACAGGRDQPPH